MKKIRIGGVPEHFNYPWHLAIKNKDFAKNNIEIAWESYSTGTGAMCKDLEENILDMAIILTEGAINALSNSDTFKLVKIFVDSPLQWGIHVPATSKLEHINDINGQTYAISRMGSGSHLMAYVDAKIRGWNTDTLKFQIVNNMDGAVESFKNKESSVFFWEKFTTQSMVDAGNFRLLDIRPTPWPCFILVARTEFLNQNVSTIQTLCDIVNQSALYTTMNPSESIENIASMYNLSAKEVELWLSGTKWNTNQQIKISDLEKIGQTLSELNLISTIPNTHSIVSPITELI
jgi:sulfonate transport system substrate-binding protein